MKQARIFADPDHYLRYFQERYQKLRPRIRSQQAANYRLNPDKARERAIAWAKDNPERVKAKFADWRRANPEKVKEHAHRRRALKLGADGSHTATDLAAIMERQRGECPWCQTDIRGRYDVDHVLPLSRGGSNGPDNLALLCRSCNTRKGNKTADEFRAWLSRPR